MVWIRKRPLLATVIGFMVVALAITTVRARWYEPAEPLGAIAAVSDEFAVHELTGAGAKSQLSGIRQAAVENGLPAKGQIYYFADGFSLSDPASQNRQANWVCIFNPSTKSAKLKFTFYYEADDPTSLDFDMPAETARSINLYNRKEVLKNRRFGAKIESSLPMVIQVTTGYFGKKDRRDWFTRAMHSVICNDTISRINYYADGLVIDKKGSRLKEPEWAFLLNPNPEIAKVVFSAYGSDNIQKFYRFSIKPQRMFPLRLDNLVVKNTMFGAKFESSIPIAIQQTRWVEETDRKTIRSAFSVMAKPWVQETMKAE